MRTLCVEDIRQLWYKIDTVCIYIYLWISMCNSRATHCTPTSCEWVQLAVLLSYWQSISLDSYTVQATLSRAMIISLFWPKCAPKWAVESVQIYKNGGHHKHYAQRRSPYTPEPEYPSCRQATLASTVDHPLPHTVPQSPFRHTSTLPSILVEPFLSLILPWVHPVRHRGEVCR